MGWGGGNHDSHEYKLFEHADEPFLGGPALLRAIAYGSPHAVGTGEISEFTIPYCEYSRQSLSFGPRLDQRHATVWSRRMPNPRTKDGSSRYNQVSPAPTVCGDLSFPALPADGTMPPIKEKGPSELKRYAEETKAKALRRALTLSSYPLQLHSEPQELPAKGGRDSNTQHDLTTANL